MKAVIRARLFAFLQLALIGALTTILPRTLQGASPVKLEHAITVLESCEGKIQTAQWKAHMLTAELSDPNDVNSITKTRPEKGDFKVVLDLVGKRYYVDYQSVSRWFDGLAPYCSARECISYDGSLYREWKTTDSGTNVPEENGERTFGTIRDDQRSIAGPNLRWWTISHMPPYFDDYSDLGPQPLSRLLRQASAAGEQVTIEEDETGIWTIAVTDPKKYGDTLEIRVDPTKGCKLLGETWLGAKDHKIWRELHIKSCEVAPNIWVPEQVEIVHTLDKPCDMARITYSDVVINSKLADEAFQCDFPECTQVDDRVANERYFASSIKHFALDSQQATPGKEATSSASTGKTVELRFRLPEGMIWPKDLAPKVYIDRRSIEDKLWTHGIPSKTLPFETLTLRPSGKGAFEFQMAPDSPPLYVTVHSPGFLQFFEAGPFTAGDIKDGVLEVPLPKPGNLEVSFDSKNSNADSPFNATTIRVLMRVRGQKTYLVLANQTDVSNVRPITLTDLPPTEYWVLVHTVSKSDVTTQSGSEIDPGRFFESKRITLEPGQEEKVNLQYVPFDLNAAHGNRTAVVRIESYDGKPAAVGREMTIRYSDGHYGTLPVFSGKVPESGEVTLKDVTDVRPSTIGSRDPYSLSIDKHQVGTFSFKTKDPTERFTFDWPPQAGDMAPDVELLNTTDGKTTKLSDLRGKLVLIDFWATDCAMCPLALESLDKLVAEQTDKWKDRVVIVPLSIDDDPKQAKQRFIDRGLNHLAAYWNGSEGKIGWESPAAHEFVVHGIPESLLIARDGRIVWRGYPAMDSGGNRQMKARIESALK